MNKIRGRPPRRDPMAIPLYGFLEGDTIGLLIVAEENETVRDLAQKLQDGASIRVAPREKVQVIYKEKVLDPELTLVQAGLEALERFDVIRGE
jgi:Toluene-4-monooxygenase system protein B (TmoB)